MLSQSQLLFLSIVLAVAGTVAFALLAARIEPEEISPSEVSFSKLGALVQVSGRPASVSIRQGGISFLLCSGECVLVRASVQAGEILEASGVLEKLKQGSRASVVGVVKEFGGSPYVQVLEPGAVELLS